jgi:phosphoserine aminotransferase
MNRVHNFNAGPAALPLSVLEQVRDELIDFNNSGTSILEHSHRGKQYESVHNEAIQGLRQVMGIPENYHVLFCQGGASQQFAMVPMNLLMDQDSADYILTGLWSQKAFEEAVKMKKQVRIAASSGDRSFSYIPDKPTWNLNPLARYLHITSNNTVYGTQWPSLPAIKEAPVVVDMSSDILSRRVDITQFGLVYAGAQKNLGPAGVTVVIIRDDVLAQCRNDIPTMLSYRTFSESNSLYNTPPTFAVYILNLVVTWIREQGGLDVIEKANLEKAGILYKAIDSSEGFYQGVAASNSRSLMNVTFKLKYAKLEKEFLNQAEAKGFIGLKGHRSVGGLRASLYNAVPAESVAELVDFMNAFRLSNMP